MNGFSGKRILFIGIGFYDYEDSIVARLRMHGAVVDAFLDRPAIVRKGLFAAGLRRANVRALSFVRQHERQILNAAKSAAYDHVLVIKGTELRPVFLETLRRQQTQAEFILYEWDSLSRLIGIEERIPYFDRILTFDRKDSVARPALKFRPLFFREDIEPAGAELGLDEPIDLCFVGWLHSDRLEMMRRIQALARSQDMSVLLYLYTGVFTWLKLSFRGEAENVHFRSLPYQKVMAINRRSGAMLDLPHADQSGMTMRAIEAIGLGKKLITTASDVVNYDFFSSENIRLIRADDLEIDRSFVCGPAAPIPESIRARYSLDAWLADVFHLVPDGCDS